MKIFKLLDPVPKIGLLAIRPVDLSDGEIVMGACKFYEDVPCFIARDRFSYIWEKYMEIRG